MNKVIALQQKIDNANNDAIQSRVIDHQSDVSRFRAAHLANLNLKIQPANRPLCLLAQGDSWFDYPLSGSAPAFGGTDIIANLRRLGATPPLILNLALHGSTAASEMSLPRQAKMVNVLQDQSNWLDKVPDAILFSAGGNDIAGDEFCIGLDFNDGKSDGFSAERVDGMLQGIKASFLALFALRDRIAPKVPIFSHCYDFPIPDGSHPICAGPWLKPSLDYCDWNVAQGTEIIRRILIDFRAMLRTLESKESNYFHLVDTQGSLKRSEWANELHPTPDGFKIIADKFALCLDTKIRKTFRIDAFQSGSLTRELPQAGHGSLAFPAEHG